MMSSRYIEEPESADSDWDHTGEDMQLSAEEIAAVLVNSYFGEGAVINEKSDGLNSRNDAEIGRESRRQQRLSEMRRKKKQQEIIRRYMLPCAVVFVICMILAGMGIRSLVRKRENPQVVGLSQNNADTNNSGQKDLVKTKSDNKTSFDNSLSVAGCYVDSTIADGFNDKITQMSTLFVQTLGGKSDKPPLNATADEETALPDSEVVSKNSIFIDVESGRIMEQMDAGARISPASMTKILTVLVAAEHITDPDDTFEITQAITDYSYVNDCSNAGFDVGERVTVRDLFYGTVLPSGADAAVGLAVYAAGSQEAFVELMNEKIDELGLSRTSHFTNCVGLYDENHYSTVYDMAVMLKAACDNSFCREVLSEHIYTTTATEQHPEGITLSNWFLRRIEDKDTHGEVLCAKTGYVAQSENCAASLSIGSDGREYICVTAHSSSSWRCIYDHVALCQQLLPE